jgi:hypothetical protein
MQNLTKQNFKKLFCNEEETETISKELEALNNDLERKQNELLQSGGAKKVSKKSSKKGSKKSSKKSSKKGSKKGSKKMSKTIDLKDTLANSKKKSSKKGSKKMARNVPMNNSDKNMNDSENLNDSMVGGKKGSQKRELPPALIENQKTNKIISEKVGYNISPALITYVARKFGDEAKASVKDPKDFKAVNKKKLELFDDYLSKNSKGKILSEIEKTASDLKNSRKKNSKKNSK